jgi:hypothetical protein
MATDHPTEQVDAALDSVLKASGSTLRHYADPSRLSAMREAMRQALSAAYIAGSNDNFAAMKGRIKE